MFIDLSLKLAPECVRERERERVREREKDFENDSNHMGINLKYHR